MMLIENYDHLDLFSDGIHAYKTIPCFCFDTVGDEVNSQLKRCNNRIEYPHYKGNRSAPILVPVFIQCLVVSLNVICFHT